MSTAEEPAKQPPLTLERITARLRERGLRITRNRVNILEALLAAREPLSLEEIQSRAGVHGRDAGEEAPDFATVFRLLTLLEELGLAHRVALGRARTHYELSDPRKHYDHLVCTACGVVRLMEEECPVGKFERRLGRKYGFTEVTHSLQFFGRCPDCTTAAPPPMAR